LTIPFFKSKNIKTGFIFGSASLWSTAITTVVGIVMIKWIEPSELGIWQSISIIQLYIPFLEFGIPNGLNRELPYLYGKGEQDKASSQAQTALSYMLLVSYILLGLTFLSFIWLYLKNVELKLIAGVAVVGLMSSFTAYQRYLTVTFRSSQSFIILSKIYVYKSVFQLVFFPIVYFWDYYGLLIYSFLITVVHVGLMHYNRPIVLPPIFNKVHFKTLSKVGLPVFGIGYLRGVGNSFSRLLLLKYGGVLSVGLFTPVSAVASMLSVFPGIMSNYLFPKMSYTLGRTDSVKTFWPLILKINGSFLLLGSGICTFIWFTIPIVINSYFNNYADSIQAIKIYSVSALFLGTFVSHDVFYAIKAYNYAYVFIALELLLRLLCPYIAVSEFQGNMLTLMAYGILASNFLLFSINLFMLRLVLSGKQSSPSNE